MSLLEAMASGVCSIATDVGDVAKCIQHEKTGILVKPGDAEALFNALRAICSDPDLRQRLGDDAASLIQNEFSTDTMTSNYCKLYSQILFPRK
jgi:glycosyltransferase involved in cell wall biosynthesis